MPFSTKLSAALKAYLDAGNFEVSAITAAAPSAVLTTAIEHGLEVGGGVGARKDRDAARNATRVSECRSMVRLLQVRATQDSFTRNAWTRGRSPQSERPSC